MNFVVSLLQLWRERRKIETVGEKMSFFGSQRGNVPYAISSSSSSRSNQPLSYPINAEGQARKQQVSIVYVIGFTLPGGELSISHKGGLCKQERLV